MNFLALMVTMTANSDDIVQAIIAFHESNYTKADAEKLHSVVGENCCGLVFSYRTSLVKACSVRISKNGNFVNIGGTNGRDISFNHKLSRSAAEAVTLLLKK